MNALCASKSTRSPARHLYHCLRRADAARPSPTSNALNAAHTYHQARSSFTFKSDAGVVESSCLVTLVPAWRSSVLFPGVAALLHVSCLFWTRATLLVVSIGWITSAAGSPYIMLIYQSSDSAGLDIASVKCEGVFSIAPSSRILCVRRWIRSEPSTRRSESHYQEYPSALS
ncbi:hypothetical protein B0H16DRAFT_933762 [Mycena metata]|uniref:Uncharacterized protein n=1 Tax=Mycena metata TaxID=1033252 RepID=A0AAD7N5Y2_9AGAR|nr:hypothetical protein B0H16DRAFT_933762 [Mycena metata]